MRSASEPLPVSLRRGSAPLRRTLVVAVIAALGALIGLGAFTFVYARGYSYLLDDPTACANCHVMRENFTAWEVSSHRSVTCNGCHTPHDLVGKYATKAEHGARHSWVFTLGDPQVIRITPRSLEVVERNCVSCHEDTLGMTAPGTCSTCHRGVGHIP